MSNKIIISLALTLLLTSITNAADIYVPDDHATIQGAVTAASEGDRIFVRPGTYAGNIDFGDVKKNLYIQSLDLNPLTCTINCAGTRGFYLHANETQSTTIEGFTITGGDAGTNTYGGAFELDGASPTIKNCIIENSIATYGGAIDIYYGSPLFLNCVIRDNTASYDGSAVECSGDSAPVFKNCLIYDNKNTFGYGSLDFYDGAFAEFENCTIADNTGVNGLGGIVSDDSEITVINSILWNNGISVSGTTVTINNSCVERGYAGVGNIASDPLFRKGYLGDYYLSQKSAGQLEDSNCIDAGDCNFVNTSIYNSDIWVTSTYNINDTSKVDLGFHYPKAGTPKQFTLKTSVSNQNHGQIKPNDPTGLIKYKQYGEVVVEANAVPGYRFSYFEYGNAAADPLTYPKDSNNPLTITMDYNSVVIARFNSNLMHKLTTYIKSGSGSVSVNPNTYPTEDPCTFDIPEDVDPVITATPAIGYVVKNWYKADTNDPNILILEPNSVGKTTYTVTNMNADTTIAVEFEWREYDLVTSVVGGNGNIAPKRGRYPAGTIVELTAIPDTGFRISAWTGCDVVPAWNTPTNTVVMNSNKTVSVQFEQNFNRVINVPGSFPYTTLQDAINNAWNGDTIKLAPGTYPASGSLSYDQNADSGTNITSGFYVNRTITILGDPEHPERVVIDGNNFTSRAFFLDGSGGAQVTINGITIANVEYYTPTPLDRATHMGTDLGFPNHYRNDGSSGIHSYGAGIYIKGSHIISNCIIQNCVALGGFGRDAAAGAAYEISKHELPIHKGGFGGDGGHAKGGGIYIESGSPIIKNTIIKDCNAIGGIGGNGGAGLNASTATPIDPNFPGGPGGNGGNGGDAMGGGIFCLEGSSPTFIACTIGNCQVRSGYGGDGADGGEGARPDIDAYDPCDATIFIQRGYGQGGHGGMPGLAYGGGVYVDDNCKAKFENCKIIKNAAKGNVAGCGGNSAGDLLHGGVWEGGLGGLVDLDTLNIAVSTAIVDANYSGIITGVDLVNLLLPKQISINGTPATGISKHDLYDMIYQVSPDVYTAKGGGVFIGGYDTFFGKALTGATIADFNNCQISENWTKGSTTGMGGYNTSKLIEYYNITFAYPSRHNRIPGFGNGLYLSDDSNTTFKNSSVENNFYGLENTTDIWTLANDFYIDQSGNPIPGHPTTENETTDHPPYTYPLMYLDIYGEDYLSYGGGLCFESWTHNVKTVIRDCNISGNTGAMGGGIFADTIDIYVADSNITNNNSYSGGGIMTIESHGTVHNSLVKNNTAGTVTMPDANFISDLAIFGTGGGIYAFSSLIDINDCTIIENIANSTGAGICVEGDYRPNNLQTPLIKNNLIAKNISAEAGGGIAALTFAEATIQNCTIAENSATSTEGMGGGIFASYSAKVSLSDNIIWKNIGANGSQVALSSGDKFTSMTITYSDIDLTETAGLQSEASSSELSLHADRLVESERIYDEINTNGKARVIVTLAGIDFTTDWSSPASVSMMQNAVAYREAQVLSNLSEPDFTLTHKMKNAPIFTATVTPAGLTALLNNSLVAHIEPVRPVKFMLAQAIPLGNALNTRSIYNGQHSSIAIVDTGVDYTHPKLGGGGFPNTKVIGGYDFGDKDANPMPIGEAHGTCCAGIAAGTTGTVDDYIGGVAYGAKIYAMKMCYGPADIIDVNAALASWDWCITHRNDNPDYPIRVMSNSWGGYAFDNEEDADNFLPAWATMAKQVVDAGITILAASGNDYLTDAISWPAALSNVISVGAVYDTTGRVTEYSNSAHNLDIFAPADPVYTTDIVGTGGYSAGDYYPYFNGTSSACPFAAGCVAALQSAAIDLIGRPLTPIQVEYILKNTGTPVTDTKVAITKPMVNLGSAISIMAPSVPIYIDNPACSLSGVAKDTSGKWTVQGSSNISADPNFVLGYYLSNIAAGQAVTSVCVNAGSVLSGNLGMNKYTTRTDGIVDEAGSLVDMGYHYNKGLKIYNLIIDTNTVKANGTTDPAPGTYKKYSNDVVQIKAIPDANARVAKWIVDGKEILTNAKTYTLTISKAHSVIVVFEAYYPKAIVVPDQYQTIQEAIDASESGDTIYIYPKSNKKPHWISDPCGLDFKGKAITIRSRYPDDPAYVAKAIIDCNNRGRAFNFRNNEDSHSVIEGLTIINGLTAGEIAEGTIRVRQIPDGNQTYYNGINADGDGFGGAIYVGENTGPTIRKCVFKNCQVTGGQGSDGGVGYSIPADSTFEQAGRGGNGGNGSGNGFGGVIFCDEKSYPKILDCTFIDNAAIGGIGGNGANGGNAYGSKVGGDGGNGGSGSGDGYGGAIYCAFKSNVKIDGCQFSGNIGATGMGGAAGLQGVGTIPAQDQDPYPDNGKVGQSSGTGFAGAIYYEEEAAADINNCQILDNRALSVRNNSGSGGGAIYFESKCSNLKIKDTALAGNDAAAGGGGAILINSGNKLELDNCYVGGNSALLNGGGIAAGSRVDANTIQLLFNDCVFSSNKSQGLGGGIFAKNTDANFVECFFNRNEAYSGGGLNFVSTSKLRFVGGTISDNNAFGSDGEGGGASLQFVPAQFINVQFIGNKSNYAAGAIMFNGVDTRGSQVLNCLFAKNRAWARGGAVVASLDSNPEFKCCTFSENEADIGGHGGAIFCTFRSSPTIMYCIFDKNKHIAIYENSADCHTYIQRNFYNENYHGDYFKYAIERLFNTYKVDSDVKGMNDYTAGDNRFTGKIMDPNKETIFRTGILGDYYLKQKNQDYPEDVDILAVDAGDINSPELIILHDPNISMAHYTTRTDSNRPGNVPCTKDQEKLDWGFHYKHVDEAYKLWLKTYVISGRGTIEPAAIEPNGYPAYMGTTVRLVAKPETGWRVRQWVGSDDDSSISTTNYVVMMNNRTVGVIFEQPKNLYLPAEYTTLQDAINASRSGDKIVVSQGTYQFAGTNFDNYGVTIHGKNITITSSNPDDPCVVANTVFNQSRFNISNVDSSMILDGITIANARYYITDRVCPSVPLGPDGYNGGHMFGGGMIIRNASPIIRNVRFVNCSAGGGDASNNCGTGGDGGWGGYGRGGAVGIDIGSSPVFKNCQFIDCFAEGGDGGNGDQSDETPGHGGSWGDPNKFVDHTWDHADGLGENGGYKPYWFYSGYGGAVYCANSTSASFEKCLFRGNNAIGGACGLSSGVTWYTWPVHNYAIDSFGGAVYLEAGSNARFTDCNFVDNTADTRGQIGDINFPYEVADWVLSDPVVSYGGAICAENAAAIPLIKNCNFFDNTACAGGGVYVEDSIMRFADSKFTNNRAMLGGAMLFIDSNSALSECDFTGNNAFAPAGQGGAIYSASSSTEFYDCQMMYNNAAVSGGAAYFGGENEPNMFNCLIAGNTANRDGGGISANWEVQLFMTLCTVANNYVSGGGYAAGFGGGLSCAYEANVKIINSIFWNNSADNGREISIGSTFDAADKRKADVTVTYSNIQGGGAGVYYDPVNCNPIHGFDDALKTNLPGTTASDPNFMSKFGWGNYFLGSDDVNDPPLQPMDHANPNVDAGADLAFAYHMYKHTTRTDLELDGSEVLVAPNSKVVDLGYHYTRVPTIKGDFNFDGKVNFDDFILFFKDPYWMNQDCQFPYFCDGRDFTEDGEVDFEDFAVFAENYQGSEKIPPTPNPMTWEIPPRSISATSIKMNAKEAYDNSGTEVTYKFECTTHPAHSSSWEPNTVYIVTGLQTGVQYGFRVCAKDENGNVTGWSQVGYVITGEDGIPPSPEKMTWAIEPALKITNGQFSITMTASTATDTAGVEYYFDEYTGNPGGNHSIWIPSTYYEDVGLEPNTTYGYRVKARDKSQTHNETEYSEVVYVQTPPRNTSDPNITDTNAPSPVEWAYGPIVEDSLTYYYHRMGATPATDASGEVWYWFEAVEGKEKTNSGWITYPSWDAGGFWGVNHCSYRFKVKDKFGNESEWSPIRSTY